MSDKNVICPQCGSGSVYTTDMGYTGADMNDVKCGCEQILL